MTFTFRPAIRENVGLLIGLAGASGSGKTYTAMRLAKGIAGDKPFCVIDTEAGRAKHYADMFRFDHGDLRPPFNPLAYADAIEAADKAGYPAIVIDSFTHEHAGVGGILDMQEAEHKRLGGGDNVKMLSWVKPKGEHRRMVARLLQVRAHLILCFRAEEKVEMKRGADGKMEVVKKVTATGIDGWVPIAEKTLPYELTASFLLLPMKPGVPLPIKLQEQHKALFPLDQPITEESGRALAEWARGGSAGSQQTGDEVRTRLAGTGGGGGAASSTQPALVAEVTRLARKASLSVGDMRAYRTTHCEGKDLHEATEAQLRALVADLKKRAGEAA